MVVLHSISQPFFLKWEGRERRTSLKNLRLALNGYLSLIMGNLKKLVRTNVAERLKKNIFVFYILLGRGRGKGVKEKTKKNILEYF